MERRSQNDTFLLWVFSEATAKVYNFKIPLKTDLLIFLKESNNLVLNSPYLFKYLLDLMHDAIFCLPLKLNLLLNHQVTLSCMSETQL